MPDLAGMHDEETLAGFNEWWDRTGQRLDPDTSEVPWFAKRMELCAYAFFAGAAAGRAEGLREAAEAMNNKAMLLKKSGNDHWMVFAAMRDEFVALAAAVLDPPEKETTP